MENYDKLVKTDNFDNLIKELNDMRWYENLYYKLLSCVHILKPSVFIYKSKLFLQKILRGWCDSDLWCLEYTFLLWLHKRLKRYNQINNVYPCHYKNFDDWKSEINNRIDQLNILIEYYYNTEEFPYIEYFDYKKIQKNENITKKEINKKLKKLPIFKNCYSYNIFKNDFYEWFIKNITELWI